MKLFWLLWMVFLGWYLWKKIKEKDLREDKTIRYFKKGWGDNIEFLSREHRKILEVPSGTSYRFVSYETGNTFLHAIIFILPDGKESPVFFISHWDSFTIGLINGLSPVSGHCR